MTKVSIIIPAYNAEPFICESVSSALAQTHRDLEIIVVNDGSTDGTRDRLREFGNRIRVHDQANKGLPGQEMQGPVWPRAHGSRF